MKSLMTTAIPSLSEGQLFPMSSNEFSIELFNNPPAQYRGAPFWAWNNKLDQEQLLGQIEIFKLMGLGGCIPGRVWIWIILVTNLWQLSTPA